MRIFSMPNRLFLHMRRRPKAPTQTSSKVWILHTVLLYINILVLNLQILMQVSSNEGLIGLINEVCDRQKTKKQENLLTQDCQSPFSPALQLSLRHHTQTTHYSTQPQPPPCCTLFPPSRRYRILFWKSACLTRGFVLFVITTWNNPSTMTL